jgi:predicted transcriptional regulator
MSEKNKGGRPLKYKTAKELQKAVDEYFESDLPKGISNLALALGFEDRQSLYDYEKRPAFSCIIKKARLRVEANYESLLPYTNVSTTGIIFALKNMGWSEKQEIKISGGDEPIKVKWQK